MWAQRRPPKSPASPPRLRSITARSSRSPMVQITAEPRLPTRARSWRKAKGHPETTRELVVRAFFLPIVLSALATPAGAQSLQVVGYSGYLGEWELTATVTERISGRTK